MIIKSMARKEPTFVQLYDYITREGDYDSDYCFTRNFILQDRDTILREFDRNSSLLSKRKNGNYLYHEIISITRAKGISEQAQKDKLFAIVQQYAESRAKDCLVFGGLHIEKDHNLHFHLMISANKYNQSRRYRLSKKQFSEVKIGLETHVLEHVPELEQAQLISAGKTQNGKISNREYALKKRTGKPTQKELFREKLQGIFKKSVDKDDFFTKLKDANIECYVRGKTVGFLDQENGRKHRLKTLGLVEEFEAIQDKMTDQKTPAQKEKTIIREKPQPKSNHQQAKEVNNKEKQDDKKSDNQIESEIIKRQVEIRNQRMQNIQQTDEKTDSNKNRKK